MTPDDIFETLLDYYQTKGIDPSLILRDPTFNRMPMEDRLRLVKKHGRALSSKIDPGVSQGDMKTFGKDALMGAAIGAGIGLQAILAYAGATGDSPKRHLPLIPIIAAGGAALGTISSGNRYVDRLAKRREIKQELERSSSSESPASGVGPLTTSYIHSVSRPNRFQTFLSQFGYGQDDYSGLKEVATGHFSHITHP